MDGIGERECKKRKRSVEGPSGRRCLSFLFVSVLAALSPQRALAQCASPGTANDAASLDAQIGCASSAGADYAITITQPIDITGSPPQAVTSADVTTISGNTVTSTTPSDTIDFTQSGAGTTVLLTTGLTTYSGQTQVTGGVLAAGAVNAFSPNSDYTVNATLQLADHDQTIGSLSGNGTVSLGSGTLTVGANGHDGNFDGVITGTGGFTLDPSNGYTGTGFNTNINVNLTGQNTFTGPTTIDVGFLGLPNGATVAGPIVINRSPDNQFGGTLALGNSVSGTAVTFGNQISGQGGIFINDERVTFTGDLSGYTGRIQINGSTGTDGGAFIVGTDSFGTSSNDVVINQHATFDLNGHAVTVHGIGDGTNFGQNPTNVGTVLLNGGRLTLGSNDGVTNYYAGAIADGAAPGGSLVKVGSNTLQLVAANSFGGGTTISGGTIQIGNSQALGLGAVTLDGGTFQAQSGQSFNVVNNFVVAAGGGVIDNNGASLNLYGSISDGASTRTLVFANTAGTRTLTVLYGVDTHSGGTEIMANADVILGAAGAFSTGALTIDTGGNLDLGGHDQALSLLNGYGSLGNAGQVFGGAPGTYRNVLTVGAGTFSGDIYDGGGSNGQGSYTGIITLRKNATGTLNLTGISLFSGGTLLEGGTIGVGENQSLGSGALTMSDGTTLRSLQGVTLANDIVLNGTDTIDSSGPGIATSPYTGGIDSTGVVSGSGTLVKTGALGLRLSGDNTYSGGTLLEQGHIGINNNNALGTGTLTFAGGFLVARTGGFTVNNAAILAQNGAIDTQSFGLTYAGQMSGPGALTKLGTGTLALTNANTYTGGTVVSAGTVQVTNSTLNPAGATLSSSVGTGAVTLDGGTLQFASKGNEVDFANTVRVGPAGGIIDSNGSYPRLSGNIVDGTTPGTLTFRNAVGRLGSNIDFILSGNNTFSGGLVVNRSTDIAIAADNAGGRGALTVNGVFDLGSHNQTFTSLSGTGYVNATGLFGAAATTAVTLSVQSGDFAGGLFQGTSDYPDSTGTVVHTAGVLALTKISDGTADGGTVILSGYTALYDANMYSGPTLIQAGTIRAGSTSALSSKSDFTLADTGNLDLDGFSNAVGSLAGTGAVYNDGANAATLTVGRTGTSTTFSGSITDDVSPLGIAKVGTGTLTLAAYNSYTGGTVISGGTVVFDRAYRDDATVALYQKLRSHAFQSYQVPNAQTNVALGGKLLSSVGSGPVTLNGGTLQFGQSASTFFNDVVITPAGGTLDANGRRLSVDGFIQDSADGTGTLVYANSQGAGTASINFEIYRPNIFSGQSVIANNTYVILGEDGALGTGALQVDAGATLDLGAFNQQVTRLTGGGIIQITGLEDIVVPGPGTYATGFLGTLSVQSGTFAGTLQNGTVTDTDPYPTAPGAYTYSATLGLSKVSDGSATGGTLVLSGSSTYSGPTTVAGGVLQAGSATAFSSNSPFTVAAAGTLDLGGYNNAIASLAGEGRVTNSGTVAARLTAGGSNQPTSFSGILADGTAPLQLLKTGTGELTLSGNNTYSGGTKLNAGSVGVGSATALGTGLVSMADGTSLDFLGSYTIANAFDFPVVGDPTFDTGPNTVVISGPISGPGALTKLGNGTLDLTAINTYTGSTDVAQGRLIVDGSIANSAVTVENGASLGGAGTVGALTVDSGATLAPGSLTPFSTLRVGGNGVTFQTGSTYRVRIDAAGQTDSVTTVGAATILGGNVAVLADPGVYAPARTYTILTADGGVTGRFDTLSTASTLAFLTPGLSYGADAITLGFTQTRSLVSAAVTPNQIGAANAIQSLGAGNRLFDAVVGQDTAGARQAFTAAAGEAHASAVTTAVLGARQVSGIVFDRLWNVAGSDDADALQVLDQFGPTTLPTLLRCYQPMPSSDKAVPSTYTVWGQGIGDFGRSGGDGNAAAVDRTLGGFAFGADTKLDVAGLEKWRVGLSGGYTNNGFNVGSGGGAGTYESIFGTLYGGARYGAVDIRLGASYGGTQTNLRRTVALPGFNERESSNNGGSSVQGFGEIGYRFALGQAVLEPVVSGAVVSVHEDDYREKGGAAALRGFAEDTLIGTTTVGFRNEASPIGDLPLVTRLFLGWQHTYGDVNPASRVAFASGSAAFETYGAPADRNTAVAEAGIDWRATSALSLDISYIGAIGARDRDNGIKGRAEYRF